MPTIEKISERRAETIAKGPPMLVRLAAIAPIAASDIMIMRGPPYMNELACQEGNTERFRVSIPTPVMTDIASKIESASRPMSAREVVERSMAYKFEAGGYF